MRNVVVKVYYDNFHIRVPFYDTEDDDFILTGRALLAIENSDLNCQDVRIEEVE